MMGQKLAHYEILAELGKGGMGEVYAAHDTKLDRKVALKLLPSGTALSPERRERFEREAKALAALNHPNIVQVYSIEDADSVPFITMELVEGEPLTNKIRAGGVGLETFFEIAVPLADAVAAAHDHGVTHRDLKPGNILIGHDGTLKVLDFGLAKLRQAPASLTDSELPTEHLTADGQIVGTSGSSRGQA